MAPNIEQRSSDSLKLQYFRNVAITRTETAVTAPVCAKERCLRTVPEQPACLGVLHRGTQS